MKPISKTAFYCCGVRMQDAEREQPVCGDTYARVFMDEEGLQILRVFKDETRPNMSNVGRHRLIDDLLRDELAENPNLTVVIIGAGFDTRAFRLKGGTWVELDEPQVISYKEERLPAATSENELHRIAIDFAAESLEQKLASLAGRSPVTVVIEGVLMYLEEAAIDQLLQTLRRVFPQHRLICDLMTRDFFETTASSMHEKFTGMGATFKFTADNPEDVFVKNGYRQLENLPIIEKSVLLDAGEMPAEVWQTIQPTLPQGYSIYVFQIP
ncbi:MAG TPA: class I SAM-dependent methyltransferase [Pyrinomonadaceae bacterium]|nr:class I SAM-dependent methyltransferase [Pyrinomonadaceae bacterium]